MKRFFKQKNKKNKAFTLVETLVAISIFTVSLLGLIAILAQGIADTNYAKRKIIASYLAQEGIEYIRNFRDTYVLYYDPASTNNGWIEFNNRLIADSCDDSCYFDDSIVSFTDPTMPMADLIFTPCTGNAGACMELRYDNATGKYNYDLTKTPSGYTREINMFVIDSNETEIVSTVSWTQGSGSHSVVFSESLFNWVE